MTERKPEASSAKPTTPSKRRGTTNSERRLRRLTADEPEAEPRGILELFPEEEPVDEDAALTREGDDAEQ